MIWTRRPCSPLAEEVLPKESGPAIPRDYGRETDLTPLEAEVSCEMEVSMPTFLLGFKCPPMSGGQEQMRRTLIGGAGLRCAAG